MNATIFRRVLWKEYRTQRAFWISVALLILMVELALLWNPWVPKDVRIPLLFGAALVCAALYGMGSAATLFATERENGTYDFLRALPVTALVVFLGKAVFAVGSTAAMFFLAWTLALALGRELPDPLDQQKIWFFFGLAGVNLLAWGILFSLLLKRPLVAAILAGTIGSIGSISCLCMDHVFSTIPVRLLIVVLVTAADIGLAVRWFRERLLRPARPPRAGLSEVQIEMLFDELLNVPGARMSGAIRAALDPAPPAATMLGRLLWQELRQSIAVTAALIAMLLPMVLFAWVNWILGAASSHTTGHRATDGFFAAGSWAALTTALLGSTVFLGDQSGCRFRFLAEHGIPPRLLWLSRQMRGLMVMLLGLLLVLPPAIGQIGMQRTEVGMPVIGCLLGFVAIAYACGQLCSMTFRSGIMAATFGWILIYFTLCWAMGMQMLGLNWLWSVAPLPLAFLIVTWLHAPDWLLERRTWRTRLRSGLVVAVPALAILVAVPLVRVYEIPLVAPGFDPQELAWPAPPEEKETLALYARAIALQQEASRTEDTPKGESARQQAEAQAVALALEASRRPLPGFYVDPHRSLDPAAEVNLADLVLASGNASQAAGRLDAALNRYVAAERIALHARQRSPWMGDAHALEVRVCERLMRWAAQDGQKSERVLKALRTFEELWSSPPAYCDDIQYNYLVKLRILEGDREGLKELRGSGDFFEIARWLPWERERAVRILNRLTAEDYARCRDTEAALTKGGCVPPPSKVEIAPALSRDFTYGVVRGNLPRVRFDDCLMVEAYRRATRLILALEAWKLDHGQLPQSLDDLAGKYLDQLPISPYTPSQFTYEPKGCPNQDRSYYSYVTGAGKQPIDSGQPFIACGYWWGMGRPPACNAEPSPPAANGGSNSQATEVWQGDWLFPIP